MTKHIESQMTELENEQAELDVPILEMGQIVLAVCDRFLINDPVPFFNNVIHDQVPAEFKIAGQLISDFLDMALEHGRQESEILRYLQIDRELSILAEL